MWSWYVTPQAIKPPDMLIQAIETHMLIQSLEREPLANENEEQKEARTSARPTNATRAFPSS